MNKNIDDIFKDKLSNFSASPSPRVWDNIANKLPKKKKKKLLPMWWFSGAAAVFILALFLFPFSDSADKKSPLPLKEEFNLVSSPKKEKKIDSINSISSDEPVLVFNNPKESKENATTKTKENHKNITKKNIESDKNLSNLVDTKIAENEIKPVEKDAMKKIFSKDNDNKKEKNVVSKTTLNDISKSKKDLISVVKNHPKEENFSIKKEAGKWSLTPVIALLSSNSFSGGSPLDETLTNNPTEGNNSISYGLKVAYQINSKWELQSGIHIQKTNYTNNNLSIISNVYGFGLTGLQTNVSFSVGASSSGNTLAFLSGAKVVSSSASLTQNYGYIEVPLEVKYTFLESKKLKSKLVTGFSSLFLTNNSISVESNVVSQKIGQANNLNVINFSGNFGLDFDYSIYKNIKLNFNPMFKIQLNTYSKNSNGFKPYLLGFYSGIKYQF